jgi:hypothetical protein
MAINFASATRQADLLRTIPMVAAALTIPLLALSAAQSQSASVTNKPDFAPVQAFIEHKIANDHIPICQRSRCSKRRDYLGKGIWMGKSRKTSGSERAEHVLARFCHKTDDGERDHGAA